MTIRNRIEIPDLHAFNDDLSRCQRVRDMAKLVQQSVGDFFRDLNSTYNEYSVDVKWKSGV
jgi:hypothetical protein